MCRYMFPLLEFQHLNSNIENESGTGPYNAEQYEEMMFYLSRFAELRIRTRIRRIRTFVFGPYVISKKSFKFLFVAFLKVTDENTAGFGSVSQRYGTADPYQNVTGPQFCLRFGRVIFFYGLEFKISCA
jgi:hypothetical protein